MPMQNRTPPTRKRRTAAALLSLSAMAGVLTGTDRAGAASGPGGRFAYVVADWPNSFDTAIAVRDTDGSVELLDLGHDEVFDPAWSPDGNELAFRARDGAVFQIYVLDLVTGTVRHLATPAEAMDPAWSPDGTHLAFAHRSPGGSSFDIWRMTSQGAALTRLTTHPGTDRAPAWSPDGGSIAFSSNRLGHLDLFTMTSAGKYQAPVFSGGTRTYDDMPTYSPQGRHLAFERTTPGSIDTTVRLVDLSSNQTSQVSTTSASAPAWSPNGQMLAVQTGGDIEVWTKTGALVSVVADHVKIEHLPAWTA